MESRSGKFKTVLRLVGGFFSVGSGRKFFKKVKKLCKCGVGGYIVISSFGGLIRGKSVFDVLSLLVGRTCSVFAEG